MVEIAGIRFGEGLPKICVPLTGGGMPALLNELQQVRDLPADLFEWRADLFYGNVLDAVKTVREGLNNRPLLCTIRTENEGGAANLPQEDYEDAILALLDRGGFELIDIEIGMGEKRARRLVQAAKAAGIGTVMSKHELLRTPKVSEMTDTLLRMRELGADLPKLAVTPRCPRDVLNLLTATLTASERIGPVVTMSMGDLGKVSRVCGQLTGSCMTFGAGVSASAPGQLNSEDLRAILEDLS